MLKRILFIACTAVLLITVFGSCGAPNSDVSKDSKLILDKNSNTQYVIIYGKNASDTIVHQASLLKRELKNKCDIDVIIQSDSDYRPNDSLENQGPDKTVEILLGETNREESFNTYNSFGEKNQYVVKIDDDKLVFAATSEQLLVNAIEKFKTDYLNENSANIVITGEIVCENSNYLFFDIVKNGYTSTTIIVADNCSSRVRDMANKMAGKINSLCKTNIKVISESEAQETEGAILIGALRDSDCTAINAELQSGDSIIKYANSKIIISGKTDDELINAISSFMGNIIMKYDKQTDGTPYIYYPTELVLMDSWKHKTPNIPGGILIENVEISSSLFSVNYSDVDSNEFNNYIELLKNLNYIIIENNSVNTDNNLHISAYTSSTADSVMTNINLSLNYNLTDELLTATISYSA